jgi:hypothetical protein
VRGFRRNPNLIRMDFVSPPFLLDFAGVQFSPPDYEQDVMDHWHKGIITCSAAMPLSYTPSITPWLSTASTTWIVAPAI